MVAIQFLRYLCLNKYYEQKKDNERMRMRQRMREDERMREMREMRMKEEYLRGLFGKSALSFDGCCLLIH